MPTTIVDKTACELAGQDQENGLLPISPFTALQFHFGMLLGVDDLETGQAYPRGKIRLHNAWLHREGVVWGLNVSFNKRGELTVDRGLALDAAGHELHLDRLACVDLGQWYVAHQLDTGFKFAEEEGGGKQFNAHVVARFKACLTRPVPSIVEPCAGSQTDTAYSRVFETVELLIRPGLAPLKDRGYHRLRILFSIEDNPAYDETESPYDVVAARRLWIQGRPIEQQPLEYLKALREFAALDEIDLAPQGTTGTEPASIFPEDPTEVVLANIADIIVRPGPNDTWAIVIPPHVPDVTVRPSHIATATIQELLCGPLFGGVAVGPSTPATGPTVTIAKLANDSITFTTTRDIAPATLAAGAFMVTDYNKTGWTNLEVKAVTAQGSNNFTIDLQEAPTGTLVRLIIRGTGPTPLLAADNHQPLGAPGAGGADDGIDFVKMFERSE